MYYFLKNNTAVEIHSLSTGKCLVFGGASSRK